MGHQLQGFGGKEGRELALGSPQLEAQLAGPLPISYQILSPSSPSSSRC